MVSIKNVAARAAKDTISFWGGWRRAFIALLLIIIGFALHYLYAPKVDPVKDEALLFVLYTLAPVGLFTMVLLIWNVICAPYRIEKEAHATTKRDVEDAQSRIRELELEIQNENPIRHDPITGAMVIGRTGGPVTLMGGTFEGGITIGGGPKSGK